MTLRNILLPAKIPIAWMLCRDGGVQCMQVTNRTTCSVEIAETRDHRRQIRANIRVETQSTLVHDEQG